MQYWFVCRLRLNSGVVNLVKRAPWVRFNNINIFYLNVDHDLLSLEPNIQSFSTMLVNMDPIAAARTCDSAIHPFSPKIPLFLAHLSICSGWAFVIALRPSSSVGPSGVGPASVHIFKHLLWNHWLVSIQTLYEALISAAQGGQYIGKSYWL